MIRAVIFDLDGTLVQSEKLKAQAYAIAVQRLRGLAAPDPRAIEAYRGIVGASRDVATRSIVEALGLENELRPLMAKYKASEPGDVLTSLRTEIYAAMVADPQVIRDNRWPHTIGVLAAAREARCKTALATMSYRSEALHVLRSLNLESSFDAILTRESVEKPKPDPAIYLLAARLLEVPPSECLVLEDSVNGIRAAVAAGTNVIGVATPFSSAGVHESASIGHEWILHEPERLPDLVKARIEEHNRTAH